MSVDYGVNAPIKAELPDYVNGWRALEVWQIAAETSGSYGDDAVGMAFESCYRRQLRDGTWVTFTCGYYVVATQTLNQPEVRDAWVVEEVQTTIWHTVEDEPGGTETFCDMQHGEGDARFFWSLAAAEEIARRNATEDERWKFANYWDGERA